MITVFIRLTPQPVLEFSRFEYSVYSRAAFIKNLIYFLQTIVWQLTILIWKKQKHVLELV